MNIELSKEAQYEADNHELLERFPHLTLYRDKNGNFRIELSSGQRLELGKVHKAAINHILDMLKSVNKLIDNPQMYDYEELKDQFGEYPN